MSNSLQDFIQQLKNIDVADLLEKAKTVKIDDIKKIKTEISKLETALRVIEKDLQDLLLKNYLLDKAT